MNLIYKLINEAAVLWINITKHMYKSLRELYYILKLP
jgi:hypothetical protein